MAKSKFKFNKQTAIIALAVVAIAAVLIAWFGFGWDPLGFFTESDTTSETIAVETPDGSADVTDEPSSTEASDAGTTAAAAATTEKPAETVALLDKDKDYTTKEDVALYIFQYHELPRNFITKIEAQNISGWTGGSLDKYDKTYGKCIGGDKFGNNEKKLPVVKGRQYYECDINTLHASSRGAERLVFTYDGTVYYTGDHYDTFTLLYGEP